MSRVLEVCLETYVVDILEYVESMLVRMCEVCLSMRVYVRMCEYECMSVRMCEYECMSVRMCESECICQDV